jgi:hypothetical protein
MSGSQASPANQSSAEEANYPDSSSRSKARPLDGSTVSVTFQNFTIDAHTWTITDLGNNTVVFSGNLNGRDDADASSSKVTRDLVSDGLVGNAEYQKEGDTDPTKASLLTDGQIVNMT